MVHSRLTLAVAASLCLAAASVLACQVPVFRYALERWTADNYEVLILHDGPLSTAAQAALQRLQAPDSRPPANFSVHLANPADVRDERLRQLWDAREDQGQPLMVVLYPRTALDVPDRLLWATSFTSAAVERLLDSPARRQLAQHLSSGASAVWIFVPCGDAAKDQAARQQLEKRLAYNQQRLTLPTAEELEIEPQVLEAIRLPLRIAFPVVSLDRQQADEAFLLRALENSEADVPSDEPLAFPVFGRGRVLYVLVGKGIMPETIDTACAFMVGPCSCQVKNQNPGFDLLVAFDWQAAVEGAILSDPLPEESAEPKLLAIPPGRNK